MSPPFRLFSRRAFSAPGHAGTDDDHTSSLLQPEEDRQAAAQDASSAGRPAPSAAPGEPAPPGEPHPPSDRVLAVRAAVRGWTSALVELGGTNNLLWQPETASTVLDLRLAHPAGLARLMSGSPTRLEDLVRETAAHQRARTQAARIMAKARELREERGILSCFLAVGEATWTTPNPARTPAAPVLLRPCVLTSTGAPAHDIILEIGEETEVNHVLVHYLATAERLHLDTDALEALAWQGEVFDPRPVYAALAEACAHVPGFAVVDDVRVATYTYSKSAMVADLAEHGDSLAEHDLIAALAGDGPAQERLRRTETVSSQERTETHRGLVLDADPAQVDVLAQVRAGQSLVIDGPPGTGKSQTIANLIAAAAADGRSVLFVAEKRAAIEAVQRRLESVGLADLILDLHDGAPARRAAARGLIASIETVREAEAADEDRVSSTVHRTAEDDLAGHADAMHYPREPWGVTAYDIIQQVAALTASDQAPRTRVRLASAELRALSRERITALGARLTELAALGAWDESAPGEDPWFGAQLADPAEAQRARDIVVGLANGRLEELRGLIDDVFSGIRLPSLPTVSSWGRLLATVASVRDTLEVFRPEVFDTPLHDIVAATAPAAAGSGLGWWTRRRLRRQARSLLRPGVPPPDLHAALAAAHHQRSAWRDLAGPGGRPEIPADLDRAQAAYAALVEDLTWLDQRLPDENQRTDLVDESFSELSGLVTRLSDHLERAAVVPHVREGLAGLREAGLGPLIDDLADRGVSPSAAAQELELMWWSSLAQEVVLDDPDLATFDGELLRARARDFEDTDEAVLRAQARLIRTLVRQRGRAALSGTAGAAAEAAIRAAARSQAPLMPLGQLLHAHGEVVRALRPALAVSPLVVAAVLPAGQQVDLVVFDEASQIAPATAVSALARGRQVVIAGDPHQLPPTSFFTATTAAEAPASEGSDTPAPESVLDAASAVLPVCLLNRHYRSRDERLVEFVNDRVYAGRLVTLPGTLVEPPLRHIRVDGEGMPHEGQASVESTAAEVDAVVRLVLEHARYRADRSLAVVTLGTAHAERIEAALRRALAGEPQLAETLLAEGPEPFVVKSVERIQGDERDDIILAVGFGKTPHGRVLHHFGPLNLPGGERRLTVALTRARRTLTIVSSIAAADLEPAKLRSEGSRMLRAVLEHAAGAARRGPTRAASPSDPLLAQLAERLRASGLVVHERVGHGDEPIDLAVERPDQPGVLDLAIEGDGRDYAAAPTVRDRERLRPAVLRSLGWRPVRVWALDLYRDPAREVSRILALTEGDSS